jgi:ABC-type lipoprotein export system ATPase subunit
MLMPERDRQRHTYVLGKSGSGKSELLKLLVYGYLRKPGSATVASSIRTATSPRRSPASKTTARATG